MRSTALPTAIGGTGRSSWPRRSWTVAGSNKNRVPNPLLKIAVKAARDVIAFGREFGLTPSSRVKLRAEGPEDFGKFNGLIGGYDDRPA